MRFLPGHRVIFVWRWSKSEAWLKLGRVARNFAICKQMLMECFKNRKKSRLKNQDTERTWTSNPLLESNVIPAPCDLIWFDLKAVNWQLHFVSMFKFIHAAWEHGRNEKSSKVILVLIYTTTTFFYKYSRRRLGQ